jgi:hypothetical protein
MTNQGVLQKIEILPGSFRLRRADLEAIADGKRMLCCRKTGCGMKKIKN